ncbi:MAG: hypothetical protein ACT4N2_04350 [Hyphomicrobium sp.]
MRMQTIGLMAAVSAAALTAGCSGDLGGLTTQTIDPAKGAPTATAAKVDPACVSLTAQIDTLRKDGLTERVEKVAATGKSKLVSVKRESLARIAELDKANAEFQAKCTTLTPRPVTAAAVAPPAAAPAAATANSAPATTGKTAQVVSPAAPAAAPRAP